MAIIDLKKSDIETNIEDAIRFTIDEESAPKLVQMMSNYLYSDKEYAVISELCANAYDAHVDIGQADKPIKVQLPTNIDPEFVVRDYGMGLSDSDVRKYLTKYGKSSKEKQVDRVGFWGIGSKSPAAVTDTWTVISYHAGRKLHYEVFVDEQGVPSLKQIFNGPTEERGLEVRVPIKQAETYVWKAAAAKAFKYYDTKPTLNVSVNYASVEYRIKNDLWGLHEYGHGNSNNKIIVNMREYILDSNKLAKYLSETDLRLKVLNNSSNRDSSIDLFFKISDVDVSISREQLQYNKKSVDAILARLQEFIDFVRKDFDSQTQGIIDPIEYRKVLFTLHDKYGFSYLFTELVKGNKFNVIRVPEDCKKIRVKFDPSTTLRLYNQGKMVNACIRKAGFAAVSIDQQYSGAQTSEWDKFFVISTDYLDRVQVVTSDCKDSGPRIRQLSLQTPLITYIVGETAFMPSYFKRIKASTLPKPPRAAIEARNRRVFIPKSNRWWVTAPKDWKALGDIVAIPMKTAKEGMEKYWLSEGKVRFLIQQGYSVIGVPDTKTKYPTVDQAIKKMYDGLIIDKKLMDEYNRWALMMTAHHYRGDYFFMLLEKMVKAKEIGTSQWASMTQSLLPIMDIFDKGEPSAIVRDRINLLKLLAAYLDVTLPVVKEVDFKAVKEACIKRYPMLQYISMTYNCRVSDVVDYIRMVDCSTV